jgi:hypothetical protein
VESNRNVISDVWVIDDIFTFALLICFYKYKNHLINLILIAMMISFVTIYVVNKHCLWYNLWRTKTFKTNCVCLLYPLLTGREILVIMSSFRFQTLWLVTTNVFIANQITAFKCA